MDYLTLPDHMKKSVKEYIENGRPIGSFLTAVFSNNLVKSFGRADPTNFRHMDKWAAFLYNEAPTPCWGSEKAVAAWIKKGGLNGHKRTA